MGGLEPMGSWWRYGFWVTIWHCHPIRRANILTHSVSGF